MTRGVLVCALKEWTGKASATKIYDSTVDEFTADGLFNMVKGKQNIALVGFTADGDVFGGFYSVAVTEQFKEFNDPNMFVFSFESHGRCATPQRFAVRKEVRGEKVCQVLRGGSIWVVRRRWGVWWLLPPREREVRHVVLRPVPWLRGH